MLIAAATAVLVFVVARALLPLPQRSAEPPAAPTLPPMASAVDAMDSAQADGAGPGEGALDAAGEAGSATVAERSVSKDPPSADDSAAARAAVEVPHADKDIARSAWRANWPDVREAGARASIIIPIKGSADGGSYRFFPKTRVVAIVLPRAASLNTMHYYRIAQAGFHALWTFQDENNALPQNGTKLRLKLDVAAVPQVELYDDFVKVSIRSARDSE